MTIWQLLTVSAAAVGLVIIVVMAAIPFLTDERDRATSGRLHRPPPARARSTTAPAARHGEGVRARRLWMSGSSAAGPGGTPRLGGVAGRIRDSDIAEVRDRTRIDEVIGEYVALRRAGAGSLKGLCPFHDEKSPSFNVRPALGTYHCFGCGEGGDAVAFVMKMEVIGFVEAVERLAARVGYRLTYEGGGSSVQRERNTRSRLLEANRAAAEFYAAQLRTAGGRAGRAVPHLPRLRRHRRDHLRLRIRAGRLGHPDQAPAGRRVLASRS